MAEVMRMRERRFCGMTIDELKALSFKEVADLLPARSRRTLVRHPEVAEKFLKSAEEKVSRKKKIRTHLRDMIILPRMVGMNIQIYTGKTFEQVQIEIEMIGHRLGEFALTRQKVNHSAAGIGATRGSKAAKK